MRRRRKRRLGWDLRSCYSFSIFLFPFYFFCWLFLTFVIFFLCCLIDHRSILSLAFNLCISFKMHSKYSYCFISSQCLLQRSNKGSSFIFVYMCIIAGVLHPTMSIHMFMLGIYFTLADGGMSIHPYRL